VVGRILFLLLEVSEFRQCWRFERGGGAPGLRSIRANGAAFDNFLNLGRFYFAGENQFFVLIIQLFTFYSLLFYIVEGNQIRQPGKPAGAALQCRTSGPHRILVVDDEPCICELNTDMLTAAGYHVDVAANGAVAWDAIRLNNYDLIITDNTMPRMTGIEMIEKMRSGGMVVPVIMASGTLLNEELTQSSRLQPVVMLPKPYTGVELLGMVKKVLGAAVP